MRRSEAGFSLTENLFAAVILGVLLMMMSSILGSYTMNQVKTADVPFAVNLAQQQLDQVQMRLATQNSMVFDTAQFDAVSCAQCPRGRSYFIRSENISVSAYYFNNFPWNAVSDNKSEMAVIPWFDEKPPLHADIKGAVYDGGYTFNEVKYDNPYIRYTLFYRNRFYGSGGSLTFDDGSVVTVNDIKQRLGEPDPPRYAVRLQLFGIPAINQADVGDLGAYVRKADRLTNYDGDPRVPPAACLYLIGDSCINGVANTGRMWIYERSANGADDPKFFPHFSAKILVARVYRVKDFVDDGTFYAQGAKFDREIASASVILVGRVQLK